MIQQSIVVRHLHEVPAVRDSLAALIYREFWTDDPAASAEWLSARLREALEPGRLPLCLVALEDGRALGVVNVIEYDNPNPRVGRPWLAGMVVIPERRAQGIGSRLVRDACAEARALGEVELYLGTDGPGFYERLGAQRYRQLREDVWLMRFDLWSVCPEA